MQSSVRARNDPEQYDDLVDEWWKPGGAFVALHWLAAARGALVPVALHPGSVLLDVACGGGLLAPHVIGKGYVHLGIDLRPSAAAVARRHGVIVATGDVRALPVADASVDVVVAGEIFEHVLELDDAVAEIARVLRPGGVLVCDTLADTWACRLVLVTLAERVGLAPKGIHDPALFVAPERLQRICAEHGITLEVRGLRPSAPQLVAWLARRRDDVAMYRSRLTGLAYQGIGVKTRAGA